MEPFYFALSRPRTQSENETPAALALFRQLSISASGTRMLRLLDAPIVVGRPGPRLALSVGPLRPDGDAAEDFDFGID